MEVVIVSFCNSWALEVPKTTVSISSFSSLRYVCYSTRNNQSNVGVTGFFVLVARRLRLPLNSGVFDDSRATQHVGSANLRQRGWPAPEVWRDRFRSFAIVSAIERTGKKVFVQDDNESCTQRVQSCGAVDGNTLRSNETVANHERQYR